MLLCVPASSWPVCCRLSVDSVAGSEDYSGREPLRRGKVVSNPAFLQLWESHRCHAQRPLEDSEEAEKGLKMLSDCT